MERHLITALIVLDQVLCCGTRYFLMNMKNNIIDMCRGNKKEKSYVKIKLFYSSSSPGQPPPGPPPLPPWWPPSSPCVLLSATLLSSPWV